MILLEYTRKLLVVLINFEIVWEFVTLSCFIETARIKVIQTSMTSKILLRVRNTSRYNFKLNFFERRNTFFHYQFLISHSFVPLKFKKRYLYEQNNQKHLSTKILSRKLLIANINGFFYLLNWRLNLNF